MLSQHISKVVSLGRRNATVPAAYSVDQKAEEDSGRLEQHVVGTCTKMLLTRNLCDLTGSLCTVSNKANNDRQILNFSFMLTLRKTSKTG